jgi:hypothetical protein
MAGLPAVEDRFRSFGEDEGRLRMVEPVGPHRLTAVEVVFQHVQQEWQGVAPLPLNLPHVHGESLGEAVFHGTAPGKVLSVYHTPQAEGVNSWR